MKFQRSQSAAAQKQATWRDSQRKKLVSQIPQVHGPGYDVYQGDCFAVMPALAPQSVDLVVADLPYGVTACAWDVPLPLPRLWRAYARVMKPTAAIILTATEPFASQLRTSKPQWYRYDLIWEKENGTCPMEVQHRPFDVHENIVVFYAKQPTYHPQKTYGHAKVRAFRNARKTIGHAYAGAKGQKPPISWHRANEDGSRHPRSVIYCPHDGRDHPTQKPVDLMGWLIRSYSNPEDLVLDNTMGVGATGVACVTDHRRFLGIELNAEFFAKARARLADAARHPTLFPGGDPTPASRPMQTPLFATEVA